MATRKPLDLSGLVATKGSAVPTPAADMPARAPAQASTQRPTVSSGTKAVTKPFSNPSPASRSVDEDPADIDDAVSNSLPLNFRVTADLRRRFRMYAAAHDLKLNELFRLAFDAYERQSR